MMRFWTRAVGFAALALMVSGLSASGASLDVKALLKDIQAVGPEGAGHAAAAKAWKSLSQADAEQLTDILAGLDNANPLAANWIRSAAEAVAQRRIKAGGQLPAKALEEFVLETEHAPKARRFAFELLTVADKTAPDRLIPGFLNDPSVEFRRDAVTRLLDQADPLFQDKDEQAIPLYQQALSGARDLDQIELIAGRLEELKQEVNLPRHFGFVVKWHVIGPFDNSEKKGYPIAYPPEEEREFDFSQTYMGKEGELKWAEHVSDDKYGQVDLNKVLGKNMGAVAYAVAYFQAGKEQEVDLRLACTNANKLWLNGQLIGEHEVYHAGTKIDQYIHRTKLQSGRNVILLKACQNEQKDAWAQDWSFQLRICDTVGTAVLEK
ncbi:MAG: hypothetical protein AB7I37_20100 [Pirellulales bacterium]